MLMEVIAICIAIALVLFVICFVSRRRFGTLGLALAAGSLLSGIWAYDAGLIVGIFGIRDGSLTSAIISAVIIVLPAIVLLFHGFSYKKLVGRIVGSLLFTALALAFLVEPLGPFLAPNGVGKDIFDAIVDNKSSIVSIGLILSVLDIFLTKVPDPSEKKSKH